MPHPSRALRQARGHEQGQEPLGRTTGVSNGVYYLGFPSASSSTIDTNTDSMLFGLTNIDWNPSFVPKMMVRGSTLLTVKIFPLSMFLNMSPAFIMDFLSWESLGLGMIEPSYRKVFDEQKNPLMMASDFKLTTFGS